MLVLLAGVAMVAYASFSTVRKKDNIEKKAEKKEMKKKACKRTCLFS